MDADTLRVELVRGTALVMQAAAGKISLRRFVDAYDNFYYFNALDGHEAASDDWQNLPNEVRDACLLHRDVQLQVVDRLYFGEAEKHAYAAAERVLPGDAPALLRRIVDEHKASDLQRWLAAD